MTYVDKSTSLPMLVALCGNPKSGKSTAQGILFEEFGYRMVDDGFYLRDIARRHLGLTFDDVSTQEGKARHTEILGKHWQNREILGEVGSAMEGLFGEFITPMIALRSLKPGEHACFGSVRKNQGRYLKGVGALVIGLRNPMAPPSVYKFDQFDHDAVDVWIDNDFLSRGFTPADARAALRVMIRNVILQVAS